MKKVIVIGIAVLLVVILAASANAWTIKAAPRVHSGGTAMISSVNNNAPATLNNPVGSQVFVCLPGALHNNTGTAGTDYLTMYKNPAPAYLNFKVFVDDGVQDATVTIDVFGSSASQITDVVGKTWGLQFGTEFNPTGACAASGVWTAAMIDAAHPVFSYTFNTSNMAGTGSAGNFTLGEISTVIPEPGSMLAMFSGLIGLVGFGIRRRK